MIWTTTGGESHLIFTYILKMKLFLYPLCAIPV